MKAKVYVVPKKSVLDPQGKAVQNSLHSLGFEEVQDVRIGRYIEIGLQAGTRDEADKAVRAMCEQLLSNPIIDEFRYEIVE